MEVDLKNYFYLRGKKGGSEEIRKYVNGDVATRFKPRIVWLQCLCSWLPVTLGSHFRSQGLSLFICKMERVYERLSEVPSYSPRKQLSYSYRLITPVLGLGCWASSQSQPSRALTLWEELGILRGEESAGSPFVPWNLSIGKTSTRWTSWHFASRKQLRAANPSCQAAETQLYCGNCWFSFAGRMGWVLPLRWVGRSRLVWNVSLPGVSKIRFMAEL